MDGKNLNRVYPGKSAGTSSERIAYFITEEIIEKANYVIDLHCGDGNEWLRPFVYMPVTGEAALDGKIEELVLAFKSNIPSIALALESRDLPFAMRRHHPRHPRVHRESGLQTDEASVSASRTAS
jgi:predicted deacylase